MPLLINGKKNSDPKPKPYYEYKFNAGYRVSFRVIICALLELDMPSGRVYITDIHTAYSVLVASGLGRRYIHTHGP